MDKGFKHSKIAIIGEAFGADEARMSAQLGKTVCFVGASGALLKQQAASARISLDNCYMDNVYLGQPPRNDFRSMFYQHNMPTDELLRHQASLRKRLESVDANVFVLVGNESLRAVCGVDGIDNYRGSILPTFDGRKAIPIIHPAHTLRSAGASNEDIDAGKSAGKHSFAQLNGTAIIDWHKIARECEFPELNLPNPNLIIEPSFEQIQSYLRAIQPGHKAAIDIEAFVGEIDCIGVSFSTEHGICIPFCRVPGCEAGYGKDFGESIWSLDQEAWIWEELQRIFWDEHIELIFQNANFDWDWIHKHGLELRGIVHDTMVKTHRILPEMPKSLEYQVSVFTRRSYHKNLIKGQRWLYNAHDANSTFEVNEEEDKELKELGLWDVYMAIDQPTFLPYKECGDIGLRVSLERKEQVTNVLKAKVNEIQEHVESLIGHSINMNSPIQRKKLLYEELGLKTQYKRASKPDKKPKVTTDKEAIEKLHKLYHKDEKLRQILEAFQEFSKYDTLLEDAEVKLDPDNRCRTVYNVGKVETGRLSSSKVPATNTGANLQNQAQGEVIEGCGFGIRSIFLPDKDEDVFLERDLAGADARIVAFISQDPGLINIFHSGRNIHISNAAIFYGKSYEEFKAARDKHEPWAETMYKNAKQIGHASNYAMGLMHLMEMLGCTKAEAQRVQNLYYNNYIGIPAWHDSVKAQLRKNRTLITPLGRRRTFFGRWDEKSGSLFKEAYAYVPQSTVADIIHIGFLQLYKALEETGLRDKGVRCALNIHDSLVLNVPRRLLDDVIPLSRKCMEVPITFPHGVEIIPTEAKMGKDWFSLETIKED
jgi:uracil-DNA glycosylase family 4